MEFKFIRNRLAEYSRQSLLENTLLVLKSSEKQKDNLQPVWHTLLLIKWIFLYSEQKYPYKKTNIEIINKLIEYISELQEINPFFLGNKNLLCPEYSNIKLNKLISLLSYQQFYLQHTIRKDSFARQIQLYSKLKSRYSIEATFQKLTGISIEDFISCSFILWAYMNPEEQNGHFEYDGTIHENFLELAGQILPETVVMKFLDLLTVDLNSAKHVVEMDKRIENSEFQPFEISIFTQHPLFNFSDRLFVFHRKILNYTINYFIYDYLKENDSEQFSVEFGHRFEKYIELGLKEVGLSYKSETQLKKDLPQGSKYVDFLVDGNILIECKAIEMKPYPNVYPADGVRYNWLSSSIVKAYSEQMMTVANAIKEPYEKFGLILTYKETTFGNGIDAWESFLQKPTEKYALENNLDQNLLPPSNLFFMDIRAWDKVILVIKEGKATLREILERARKNDKNPTLKGFLFSTHLNEYNLGAYTMSYINEGYKDAILYKIQNGKATG